MYSFAVSGKFAPDLANLDNKSSFGKDSPFAFFHKFNTKMIILNLSLNHSFTFVHYCEEMCGATYRFQKEFRGDYVDENGVKSRRIYSMFVRKNAVRTQFSGLEKLLLNKNAMKINKFRENEIKIIALNKAYEIICDDILQNNGRNLHVLDETIKF